jgi:hypothetical protein
MTEVEKLQYSRNLLLSLHKSLLDFERAAYEDVHGKLNAAQFLNLILEDQEFSWLRKFSMLIVEIDEMFDLKDGIPNEMVVVNLNKIRDLVELRNVDEDFRDKYRAALKHDVDSAASHARLQAVLSG